MILLIAGMGGLVQLLIGVLIALIVLALLYWLINTLAPEPIRKYATAVVVVIAVIILLYFLMDMYQGGGVLSK